MKDLTSKNRNEIAGEISKWMRKAGISMIDLNSGIQGGHFFYQWETSPTNPPKSVVHALPPLDDFGQTMAEDFKLCANGDGGVELWHNHCNSLVETFNGSGGPWADVKSINLIAVKHRCETQMEP